MYQSETPKNVQQQTSARQNKDQTLTTIKKLLFECYFASNINIG